jgi:predicted phosphodiesterase
MRVALFSDMHGNSIALDAVLSDIDDVGGVNEYWALGDLVALGPDPVGVIERLDTLEDVSLLGGNTDRYVTTGDRPPPSLADAAVNPDLVSVLAEVAGSFAWTAGYLTAAGLIPWLEALPSQFTRTLPDGTRVLAVHASPNADDGPGIDPRASDAEQAALLAGCGADIVFGGHTHRPVDRQVGPIRAVNLGSVSNPVAPDLRASYVILDADTDGYRVEHRRVAYDRAAVIDAVEQLKHPGRAYVIKHHLGEMH